MAKKMAMSVWREKIYIIFILFYLIFFERRQGRTLNNLFAFLSIICSNIYISLNKPLFLTMMTVDSSTVSKVTNVKSPLGLTQHCPARRKFLKKKKPLHRRKKGKRKKTRENRKDKMEKKKREKMKVTFKSTEGLPSFGSDRCFESRKWLLDPFLIQKRRSQLNRIQG